MENRVFLLFFLIVALSFLFAAASAGVLSIRKKHTLSYSGILWIVFFIAVSAPIIHERSLLDLELFVNHTGGIRLEIHETSSGALLCDNIYISKQILNAAHCICELLCVCWLINIAARFSYGIAGYFNNLHFLTKHSTDCHDDKIQVIFLRAKKKAGIHRTVSLRVMKNTIRFSPCTCGIFFSSVYIGEEYLHDYSDLRLELIFLHELMHIRHHDAFLKLAALFVCSGFSFLPHAQKIRTAISEDAEIQCDNAVLSKMGNDILGEYIAMILDVAERNLQHQCQRADFLSSVSRSGEMLLRRYQFMKERKFRNSNATHAFPAFVAAIVANMMLFSLISVKDIDNPGVDLASPLIEEAVCAYFDITDPHSLTEQDLAQIYSLEFSLSDSKLLLDENITEKYALSCTLNEGLLWNGQAYAAPVSEQTDLRITHTPIPPLIRSNRFHFLLPNDFLQNTYTPRGEIMVLNETRVQNLQSYLLTEYRTGNSIHFFVNERKIDTRDIPLFTGLRTLIFSDRLQPSDENICSSENYAVICRDE